MTNGPKSEIQRSFRSIRFAQGPILYISYTVYIHIYIYMLYSIYIYVHVQSNTPKKQETLRAHSLQLRRKFVLTRPSCLAMSPEEGSLRILKIVLGKIFGEGRNHDLHFLSFFCRQTNWKPVPITDATHHDDFHSFTIFYVLTMFAPVVIDFL